MRAYRRGLHPRAADRARFQVLRHREERGPCPPPPVPAQPEYVTELERMAGWYTQAMRNLQRVMSSPQPWRRGYRTITGACVRVLHCPRCVDHEVYMYVTDRFFAQELTDRDTCSKCGREAL